MYDPDFVFDLTEYEEMFIGDQTFVDITYHTSLNDVTTGEDPIDNPAAFHNIEKPANHIPPDDQHRYRML